MAGYVRFDLSPAWKSPPRYQPLIESVAAIVVDGGEMNSGKYPQSPFTHDGSTMVCEGTPLRGEPALDVSPSEGTVMTGTVVGPRAILTARHVLCDDDDLGSCRDAITSKKRKAIVLFGWRQRDNGSFPIEVKDADRYVIEDVAAVGDPQHDWAVACVDRDFEGHPPIQELRPPEKTESAFSFAHPFGVHLQYIDCATIREDDSGIWSTLDSTPGCSGAPLFGADGALIGVQARGGPPDQAKLVARVSCPTGESQTYHLPWNDACCPGQHGKEFIPACRNEGAPDPPTCADGATPRVCCQDYRPFKPESAPPSRCSQDRPPRLTEDEKQTDCMSFLTCEADGCCDPQLESRAAVIDDGIEAEIRAAAERCSAAAAR